MRRSARGLLAWALGLVLAGCANLPALEALLGAERYPDAPLSYALVRDETLVRFEAGSVRGRFRVFDGRLAVPGPGIESGTLSVTIATGSIDVANPLIEQTLRGEAWFASSQHPLARFSSTRIDARAYPPLIVRGPFTLRGVTRDITLDVQFPDGLPDLDARPERIAFDAQTHISRSAFGMDAMPAMADDTVRITVHGVLRQQPQNGDMPDFQPQNGDMPHFEKNEACPHFRVGQ